MLPESQKYRGNAHGAAQQNLRPHAERRGVGVEIDAPAVTGSSLSEVQLTALHALATKAKDWDLVEALVKQLQVLAKNERGPNVTSIETARKRLDGKPR